MDNTRVAGVILAAGLSRRFDGNKLLTNVDGAPMAGRVLKAALASRLSPLAVVLGHDTDRVKVALGDLTDDPRVIIVHCTNFTQGQSASVIAGLRAIKSASPAAMFLMADQPLMEAEIIDTLIAAFLRTEKTIVYPRVQGQRTNPVIFDQCFFPDLLALSGDIGGRNIIRTHPDKALVVEFDRKRNFRDVDRMDDLDRLHGDGEAP